MVWNSKICLDHLDVDSILESGTLRNTLKTHPFLRLPPLGTAKSRRGGGPLLEGRVANRSGWHTFVLTAPLLFIESFQTAEDIINASALRQHDADNTFLWLFYHRYSYQPFTLR